MTNTTKEFYEKSIGEVRLTWEDVEESALAIIEQMRTEQFEPDIIISIARSGLIPAALISYALGNKELYVIKIDFSKTQQMGSTEQELRHRPKISQELSKDIEGLKVLVVDEMAVSGSTLQLVSDYLTMKHPGDVRYAVLYKQPWSQFQPNYFGREIQEWPLYPWKELRNDVLDPRARDARKALV